MKKLLTYAAAAALTLLAVVPAAKADFNAVGSSVRNWDGTVLRIRSLDSGQRWTFYGTPESCGSFGTGYDNMGFIINDSYVTASIRDCGRRLVKVCLEDRSGNSGCSAYSKVRIRNDSGGYW